MQELDNKTDADLFLTKAFEEVWVQRLNALSPGQLGMLYKIEKPEAFCYALSNGRVVFAIPVKELPDSYLLALPAILVKGDSGVNGQPLVSEPAIRIFKSSILFVSHCADKHIAVYYSYIFEKKHLLQGLLTDRAIAEVGESARDFSLASAFSVSSQGEGSDEDEDDDNTSSSTSSVSSTIPTYYNKRTKH